MVGWSSVEFPCLSRFPTLPVAWTPSFEWKDNQFGVSGKMQTLDIAAFTNPFTGQTDLDRWYPLDVNDFGQILGIAQGRESATAWPRLETYNASSEQRLPLPSSLWNQQSRGSDRSR
jgi:hypothetical protein